MPVRHETYTPHGVPRSVVYPIDYTQHPAHHPHGVPTSVANPIDYTQHAPHHNAGILSSIWGDIEHGYHNVKKVEKAVNNIPLLGPVLTGDEMFSRPSHLNNGRGPQGQPNIENIPFEPELTLASYNRPVYRAPVYRAPVYHEPVYHEPHGVPSSVLMLERELRAVQTHRATTHVHHTETHHNDHSTQVHGAITVNADDPRAMMRELHREAARRRLTASSTSTRKK